MTALNFARSSEFCAGERFNLWRPSVLMAILAIFANFWCWANGSCTNTHRHSYTSACKDFAASAKALTLHPTVWLADGCQPQLVLLLAAQA